MRTKRYSYNFCYTTLFLDIYLTFNNENFYDAIAKIQYTNTEKITNKNKFKLISVNDLLLFQS